MVRVGCRSWDNGAQIDEKKKSRRASLALQEVSWQAEKEHKDCKAQGKLQVEKMLKRGKKKEKYDIKIAPEDPTICVLATSTWEASEKDSSGRK